MPKVVDLEARRALFVEASSSVIANEGLSAATLRRVSAEAGFTMGALMHYFDDRQALLLAALRAAHVAAGSRMLAASASAGSPAERLNSVLLQALPLDEVRLREWRVWLAFWGEAMSQPLFMAENTKRYDEWTGVVHACLREWPTPPRLDATGIVARIDGFGLRITLSSREPTRMAALRREAIAEVDRMTDEREERGR